MKILALVISIFIVIVAESNAELPVNFDFELTLPDSIAGFSKFHFIESDVDGTYQAFIDDPNYYAIYSFLENEIVSYFQKEPGKVHNYGYWGPDSVLDFIEVSLEIKNDSIYCYSIIYNYTQTEAQIDTVRHFQKKYYEIIERDHRIERAFIKDINANGISELYIEYKYTYYWDPQYGQQITKCFVYDLENDTTLTSNTIPVYIKPDVRTEIFNNEMNRKININKRYSSYSWPGDNHVDDKYFDFQRYMDDSLLFDRDFHSIVSCKDSKWYTLNSTLASVVIGDFITENESYEAIMSVIYSSGEIISPYMTGCSKSARWLRCFDLSSDTGLVELWTDSGINSNDYLFMFNDNRFPNSFFGVSWHTISQYNALNSELVNTSEYITDSGHEIIVYHPLVLGGDPYIIYSVGDKLKFYSLSYTTDIENYDSKILPEKFYLSPPYPNPFNGYVKIDFGIPSRSSVELSIFNMLGQRIKTLINNEYYSGEHSINWDGTNESGENVSSGVYLIKIETEEFKSTRKTILLQ